MPRLLITLTGVAVAGGCLLLLPKLHVVQQIAELSLRLVTAQLFFWLVTLVLMIATFIFSRQAFLKYIRLNQFSGAVQHVRWAGIKANENWRTMGWQSGFFIAAITLTVVYFQNPFSLDRFHQILSLLPVIFLLAASNSLVEELIFRLTIVANLETTEYKTRAPLLSGIIFGGAHYFGAPGGLPGVLMAGFLGWFLAKSMQETGGMFWAWTIHFILDVIIFSILLLN